MYWCLSVFKTRYSKIQDVRSCLFHAISSKEEEMIGSHATAICHDSKSHKMVFILWIYSKMTKFESWDFVSFRKSPAMSCLQAHCQFSPCFAIYFSLCENMMCGVRAPWLVGRSNSNYRDAGQLGLHSFPAEKKSIFLNQSGLLVLIGLT